MFRQNDCEREEIMGRPAQDITESELSVLRVLWDRGTATIRQLTDVLYPRGGPAQYATVQKLLDRMEAKGYVRRDRTLFVHVFEPVQDRDELIGHRLRSLAEMLCDGSLTPLLTHLARAKDLTEEDRLALRAIMEEAEPDNDVLEIDHGKDSAAESDEAPRRPVRARSPGRRRGGPDR
jgi:predicted transcriptional regulator